MMCLWASYKKQYEEKKFVFVSLKSLKKGVRTGVGSGSGSISQRYGSGDPDPHQNVTDPQHCFIVYVIVIDQVN
jgi:hypothetical protein